jgi:fibronectin type 3 domain-containing protein
MKKLSAYLLLLSLIVILISACGSGSDTPAAAPSPPSTVGAQLRADAGDQQVTLYWPMVATADTYNVYYKAGSDPTKTIYDQKITGLKSAPYNTGQILTNGTTYYFAFTAVSTAEGESDLSNIVPSIPSAPPPPAAPKNVRANAGDADVIVTWDSVSEATSYNLYYQKFSSDINDWSIPAKITGVNSQFSAASNITIENSTSGKTVIYSFWVTAINDKGTPDTSDDLESSESFAVYAYPRSTPPPMAPVLEPPELVGSTVKLTWNAVTATPAVTHYYVYVGMAQGVTKDTGAPSEVSVLTDPMTTDATLPTGTYYIVVTAVNANGESTESNEVSVTVP